MFATGPLSKLRILIVDSELTTRSMLREVLIDNGADAVETATGADDAIEALKLTRFDFVITDYQLRTGTGLDFINDVRTTAAIPNNWLPIIILAAGMDKDTVINGIGAGATDVISKPIIPNVLLKRIEKMRKAPRPTVKEKTYNGPDRRIIRSEYDGSNRRG